MVQYLCMMMSSWAIVCDVWYLPPMYRKKDESAIDFANRVKSVIARQGGLVDLQWYKFFFIILYRLKTSFNDLLIFFFFFSKGWTTQENEA